MTGLGLDELWCTLIAVPRYKLRAAPGIRALVGRIEGHRHRALDGFQADAGLTTYLGYRAQQSLGVGMLGRVKNLSHAAKLDDLAQVHDCDLIGHVGDYPQVVGDKT